MLVFPGRRTDRICASIEMPLGLIVCRKGGTVLYKTLPNGTGEYILPGLFPLVFRLVFYPFK